MNLKNKKEFRLKQVVGVGLVGERGLGYAHTINGKPCLSVEIDGKRLSVLCPVCFSNRIKWFDWREAKLIDIEPIVDCINGHQLPKSKLLIGKKIKGV